MKNKIIGVLLIAISPLGFYYGIQQLFLSWQAISAYKELGNPAPYVIMISGLVWIAPAGIALFFGVKFLMKKTTAAQVSTDEGVPEVPTELNPQPKT